MKKIISILFCALLVAGSLSLTGCHTPDKEIDQLSLDRAYSPLNFKLSLVANVNATFSWTPLATSEQFRLSLIKVADNKTYKEVTLKYDGESASMSYTFSDLPGNTKFIASLQGLSKSASSADSKAVQLPFETGLEQLFLNDGTIADEDITATTAVMRWIPESNVTHLAVDNGFGEVQLDAAAKTSGVYKLTGLTQGKTYVVSLCRDDAVRGTCTFVASDKIEAFVIDKSATSLTIKWDQSVTVSALKLSTEGEADVDVTLTAAQQAAHTYAFQGLKAKTDYIITLFKLGVESGKLFATTLGQATEWDFTTWAETTYNTNAVVNEMTILSASGKEMYISADADYGVKYLDMKGKSTIKAGEAPTQRAVKFSVNGEGVIVIDCYANGSGRSFYAFIDALATSTAAVEAPTPFQNRGKIYIPCQGFSTPSTISIWTDNTINHVYSIKWYDGKEAPGQTAQPLAAPVVTAAPATVTVGDAEAVKFSWAAVANAVAYDWIIKLTKADGTAQTLRGTANTPETTLAADVVKDLKATDPFVMYVVAKPAGEFQFRPSAPGSASLTVSDTKLAKPVVALAPAKVDKGASTPVVASWAAVANAASYDVSFNGGTAVNVTATTYTVAGATVAALAEGSYTVSVVAKPAEADKQASDAGTATLVIAKPTSGGGTAYEWTADDIRTIWEGGFAKSTGDINAAALATMVESADLKKDADGFTYKGLSFLFGSGKFKFGENNNVAGTKVARAQYGGTGSTIKQCLTFVVDAPGKLYVETASSSTVARALGVDVGGTELSKDAPVSTAPEVLEFDCSAASNGTKISIYSKNSGINVFSIKWTPNN